MHSNPASTVRRPTRARVAPAHRAAPAIYIGTLDGFRDLPPIDLFNLLAPVGDHPAGSTVSRRTLERHGFAVPRHPARQADAHFPSALRQCQRELPVAC